MHLPDGKSSRAIESLTRRKHVSLLLRSCIARIQLFPRVREARLYQRYVRYGPAINKQLHPRPSLLPIPLWPSPPRAATSIQFRALDSDHLRSFPRFPVLFIARPRIFVRAGTKGVRKSRLLDVRWERRRVERVDDAKRCNPSFFLSK